MSKSIDHLHSRLGAGADAMNRSACRTLLTTALFCGLSCAAALPVLAQRAVPVESVDAQGRNAYFESHAFVQNVAACPPNYCFVRFAPVPVGKRLVVTHVAVRFFAAAGFGVPYLELGSDVVQNGSSMPLPPVAVLASIAADASSIAVMSAPVTWYAATGTTPTILVIGPNAAVRFSLPSLASISGYFVNLP